MRVEQDLRFRTHASDLPVHVVGSNSGSGSSKSAWITTESLVHARHAIGRSVSGRLEDRAIGLPARAIDDPLTGLDPLEQAGQVRLRLVDVDDRAHAADGWT